MQFNIIRTLKGCITYNLIVPKIWLLLHCNILSLCFGYTLSPSPLYAMSSATCPYSPTNCYGPISMKNLALCDHLTAATLDALISTCPHSICSVVYGSGNADLAGVGVGYSHVALAFSLLIVGDYIICATDKSGYSIWRMLARGGLSSTDLWMET